MTDTVNVPQEMIDAVMKVAVGVDECGSEVFPGQFVAAELIRAMLAAAPKAVNVPRGYEYRLFGINGEVVQDWTWYGDTIPEGASATIEFRPLYLAAAPKAEPKVIGMIGHVSHGKSELSGIVAALTSAQQEAPKAEPVLSCKNCGTVRGITNECDCSLHDGSPPEWETVKPEAPKVGQEPVRRLAIHLAKSIANLGYPVGMGISPPEEECVRAAEKIIRSYTAPPAPASDELRPVDRDKLPPLPDELFYHYESMSAQSHEYEVQQYTLAAIAKHKGPQS